MVRDLDFRARLVRYAFDSESEEIFPGADYLDRIAAEKSVALRYPRRAAVCAGHYSHEVVIPYIRARAVYLTGLVRSAEIKSGRIRTMGHLAQLLVFGAEYEELCKVSHRPYSTGFYLGRPDETGQVYGSSSYIRDYDLVGIVTGTHGGTARISQRNRFFRGDTVEIIRPGKNFLTLRIERITDETGAEIEVANHAGQTVFIPVPEELAPGSMLRRRRG